MVTNIQLLSSIREALAQTPIRLGQVAALGCDIYQFSILSNYSDDKLRTEIIEAFHAYLKKYAFQDVISHQIHYALRLVQASSEIEYEEIHKLFSLCDEIEALKCLNIPFDEPLYSRFQASLREWCAREQKKARLVAEDKVEDWSRSWWWYADNLRPK